MLATLRTANVSARARLKLAGEAFRERFPARCPSCEGEGLRPEAEGGFEVCSSCVSRGLDPLDTRLSLLCDAEGLTPLEAVEEGELDALTMPSTGAHLSDWSAHPQRELEALQEEVWEVEEALRQEELDAVSGGA